jgi:phospholipid transport system substrate-binding protein
MRSEKSNKWKCFGFWSLVLAGVMIAPAPTKANESPLVMIRTTVERSMAVLKDPAYQGDANFQKRIAKIEEIVLPRLDSLEFGRRCLGVHWQKLTEAQREEFIALFKDLIEKAYGGMLDRYPEEVRFSYDEERIDGKFAEVHTQVENSTQNKSFSVVYRLQQKEGKWLIYDVVAENVSMVQNYRNQFSRILNKSSYEELAQALRRKIQQLGTAPTS